MSETLLSPGIGAWLPCRRVWHYLLQVVALYKCQALPVLRQLFWGGGGRGWVSGSPDEGSRTKSRLGGAFVVLLSAFGKVEQGHPPPMLSSEQALSNMGNISKPS